MNYQKALNIFQISIVPSSEKELSVLYKKMARIYHPDMQGGSHFQFIQLQEANEFLQKIIEKSHLKKNEKLQKNKHYSFNEKTYRSSSKNTEDAYNSVVFKQVFNFKISIVFFLCYLFNIKVFTKQNKYPYAEKVTVILFKNKEYILSVLPKPTNKNQVFKYQNVLYRFKPSKTGIFKLNDQVRFLFF